MPPPDSKTQSISATPPGDSWSFLRKFTPARIALGRSGGSQTTRALLEFRLEHARARDAVQSPFSLAGMQRAFSEAGLGNLALNTQAHDRKTHLLRPDLGRLLDAPSRASLSQLSSETGPIDLVLIVSDGLSALAAERHALAVLKPLVAQLTEDGWRLSPVFLVPYARVKLQDEIGQLLGAKLSLMLLGERPGLGVPDSLGAYLTAAPSSERTDADRNCVSNIRPGGLPPPLASGKLAWLLRKAHHLGFSGVDLKGPDMLAALPESGR